MSSIKRLDALEQCAIPSMLFIPRDPGFRYRLTGVESTKHVIDSGNSVFKLLRISETVAIYGLFDSHGAENQHVHAAMLKTLQQVLIGDQPFQEGD